MYWTEWNRPKTQTHCTTCCCLGPTKHIGSSPARAQPNSKTACIVFTLGDLPLEDSIVLLQQQAARDKRLASEVISAETINKIYATIGGHPATLRQIPHLLTTTSLDAVLAYIQHTHTQAIYKTIWHTLTAEGKAVLIALCHLGSVGGNDSFVRRTTGLDVVASVHAIQYLADRNLIEISGDAACRRYSLHRLTQQFLHGVLAEPTHWQHATLAVMNDWCDYTARAAISNDLAQAFAASCHVVSLYKDGISAELKSAHTAALLHLLPTLREYGWSHGWEATLQQAIIVGGEQTGDLLNLLAVLYRTNGDVERAIAGHHAAERHALHNNNATLLMRTYKLLAQAYFQANQLDKAVHYSDHALEAFAEDAQNQPAFAALLSLRGAIAVARGSADVALKFLEQAVEIYAASSLPRELARAYYNLGRVQWRMKDDAAAIRTLQQANRVLRISPNPVLSSRIALQHSTILSANKRHAQAEQIIRAIDFDYLLESHNTILLAKCWNNLAFAQLGQGHLAQAEQTALRSIELCRENNDWFEEANSYDTLGDVLMADERHAEAVTQYHNCMSLLLRYPEHHGTEQLLHDVQIKIAQIEKRRRTLNPPPPTGTHR